MIKKLLVPTLAIFLPFVALAHGGVSKNIGKVVVNLNQSPISPLVGERVDMSFIITDQNFQPIKQLPVKLTLNDTYPGDESKDKVILVKDLQTDNNGDFSFSYTFNKENYFDLDLDFKDPISGADDSTGFLVQPRNVPGKNPKDVWAAVMFGLFAGWALKSHWPRRHNQA